MKPDIYLYSPETLVGIARFENFAAAAMELGVSQPTISFRIAKLEEQLDAALVERRGRTMKLTAQGTALLPVAKEICFACATRWRASRHPAHRRDGDRRSYLVAGTARGAASGRVHRAEARTSRRSSAPSC